MKKLMIVIGLTGMLMLVAPLTALAASFQWSVQVANSTSTAYSNVPFSAPISTAAWISSNYIQSNGLDVKVMDGTTALPTEVTANGLWWAGKIGKNTTKTFTLSTGNTPATSMPIIVGSGGQITTPYTSTLDLGTVFEIDINGYLNLSVNGTIVQFGGFGSITTASGHIAGELDDTGGEADFVISGSGVTSGVYDITLTGNGSHYTLAVGSHTDVKPETNGFPVSETSWIWDTNNVMPYVNSVVLTYVPASTIYSTCNGSIGYNDVLYEGGDGVVTKINTAATMSTISTWTEPDANAITSLVFDGEYIYAGTYTVSGGSNYPTVYKIDPSTMSTAATWVSSASDNNVAESDAAFFDTAGASIIALELGNMGTLYAASQDTIFALNGTNMTWTGPNYNESYGTGGITAMIGEPYELVVSESGDSAHPAYIVDVSETTMEATSELELSDDWSAGYYTISPELTGDGTYLYFGYGNGSGARVDQLAGYSTYVMGYYSGEDMSITGTFNEIGHGVVTALATYGVTVNSVTTYTLLVGLSQSPATVELVDTSTMTGIDSWTGTGQNVDTLGLYSSNPSFGAVVAERGSPAKLEQINLNVSTAMIAPQSFSTYYVPFDMPPNYYSIAQAEALSSSTSFSTSDITAPYTTRYFTLGVRTGIALYRGSVVYDTSSLSDDDILTATISIPWGNDYGNSAYPFYVDMFNGATLTNPATAADWGQMTTLQTNGSEINGNLVSEGMIGAGAYGGGHGTTTETVTNQINTSGDTVFAFESRYDAQQQYYTELGNIGINPINVTYLSGISTVGTWHTPASASVEALKYQPTSIIQENSGTGHGILPNIDDSTGDTDGSITWGTNPASTTTTFGGFMPVTTATAPIGGGGGNPTSQYPGGMPSLTSEGNFSNIPGAGVVDPVLNSSDIPLDLFWDILIFVGILALGFYVMVLTNQIWIVGVACSVGFAIFSYNTNDGINFTGGVLPFWTVIVCIMATIVVGIMQDRGVIKI